MKKNQIIVGIVIVLIVVVVLLSYVMLHTDNGSGSSFSLGQYLNGLAQAAMDKEATTGTMTPTAITATSAPAQAGATPRTGSTKPVLTAAPYLTVLSPSNGTAGLTVVIGGGNFDASTNYITFGPSDGQHTVNGLPDNVIAAEGSPNGTTLTFNVPLYGPSELQCDSTGQNCVAVPPTVLPDGSYAVTVKTDAGVSNQLYFTLKH